MAPEVYARRTYGPSVDWWSFGCCLALLLCGYKFARPMLKRLHKGPLVLPRALSPAARDLLTRLLNKRPEKRLGSGEGGGAEVMAHDFFTHINWEAMRAGRVYTPLEVYSAFDASSEEEEEDDGRDAMEGKRGAEGGAEGEAGLEELGGVSTQRPKAEGMLYIKGFDYVRG